MSRVEFGEETSVRTRIHEPITMFEGVVIRMGLAKDKKTAQKILIVLIGILCISVLSIFLLGGPETFDSDEYPEGYLNDPMYVHE